MSILFMIDIDNLKNKLIHEKYFISTDIMINNKLLKTIAIAISYSQKSNIIKLLKQLLIVR